MRQTPRVGCAALLAAVALYVSAHAADARRAVRPSVADSAAVLLGRARPVAARVTLPAPPPSSVLRQSREPILRAECHTCDQSSAAAVKKQPLPRPHVEAFLSRESRVLSWTGFQIVGFGDELTVGQRDFIRLTLTGPDGRRVHFLRLRAARTDSSGTDTGHERGAVRASLHAEEAGVALRARVDGARPPRAPAQGWSGCHRGGVTGPVRRLAASVATPPPGPAGRERAATDRTPPCRYVCVTQRGHRLAPSSLPPRPGP